MVHKIFRIDDEERRMWVENDEGLYNYRLSTRMSVTEFVRTHRAEIDAVINK
jgi:hypothetical protein